MKSRSTMIMAIILVLSLVFVSTLAIPGGSTQSITQMNDNETDAVINTESIDASAATSVTVYYFWAIGCGYCTATEPFINSMIAKYPQVTFLKLVITNNAANYQLYKEFNAAFHTGGETTPSLFIKNEVALIGPTAIKANLESNILRLINNVGTPAAPGNLVAKAGNGNVVLTWSIPYNGGSAITGYKVYRSTVSGAETLLVTLGSVTSYTNSGLTNGVTYFYKVAAVNAKGTGAMSAEVRAVPSTVPTTGTVPGMVTGLTATATGASGVITLTWTAPSNGGSAITGYKIYRGWSSGTETLVTTIGPVTSYTNTWLTNGVTYYYKVAAVNVKGTGAMSAEVHASPSTAPITSTVPGTVTGVTATGASGVITLTWTAPSNGGSAITGYKIYRSTASGAETLLTTVGSVTSYTNSGLTNGVTYFYKVAAVNAKGTGAMSSEVKAIPHATTATVPGAVTGLTATATGASGVIKLTWTAPSNGGSAITGYKIYRGWSSGTETYVTTIGPTTSFTNTWMTNGVTYYYKVAAVNAIGTGAMSAEVHAAPSTVPITVPTTGTVPGAVTGLTATATGASGVIKLTWTAPYDGGTAITGYKIYRGWSSGTETYVTTIGATTSFTNTWMTNGVTYYYKVAAVNAIGSGAMSSEVKAVPYVR